MERTRDEPSSDTISLGLLVPIMSASPGTINFFAGGSAIITSEPSVIINKE